jgi:hypothetical protein
MSLKKEGPGEMISLKHPARVERSPRTTEVFSGVSRMSPRVSSGRRTEERVAFDTGGIQASVESIELQFLSSWGFGDRFGLAGLEIFGTLLIT